jgi:hypothetical protein
MGWIVEVRRVAPALLVAEDVEDAQYTLACASVPE